MLSAICLERKSFVRPHEDIVVNWIMGKRVSNNPKPLVLLSELLSVEGVASYFWFNLTLFIGICVMQLERDLST